MTALRLADGTVCRTGPTCRLHGNLHTLQEQVYATYMSETKKNQKPLSEALQTQTPVEVDTQLAKVYGEYYSEMMKIRVHQDRLQESRKRYDKGVERKTASYNLESMSKDITYYEEAIVEAQAKMETHQKKMDVYDGEFERRGGWTRAFWVANSGGHVHRSMQCSTCYPTTNFQWLTDYSGKEENEIVGDAGDRACTVCYSSAPVDLLRRPSKINDPEKEAARKVRDEKKRVKDEATAAKAIANPDDTPLKVNGWVQKTERSAESAAVGNFLDYEMKKIYPEWSHNEEYMKQKVQDAEKVLVALAHKHKTTVEEERERVMVKVNKKVKATAKEMGIKL